MFPSYIVYFLLCHKTSRKISRNLQDNKKSLFLKSLIPFKTKHVFPLAYSCVGKIFFLFIQQKLHERRSILLLRSEAQQTIGEYFFPHLILLAVSRRSTLDNPSITFSQAVMLAMCDEKSFQKYYGLMKIISDGNFRPHLCRY